MARKKEMNKIFFAAVLITFVSIISFTSLTAFAADIPDKDSQATDDGVEVVTRDGSYKIIKHPDAAKGLIRINKDGSYQYRVPKGEKTKSASLQFASLSAPSISTSNEHFTEPLTFSGMYGTSPWAIMFNYEWQLRKFGTWGLQLGSGLGIFTGKGRLVSAGHDLESEEKFTLFLVPMTAYLVYRFEYSSKQWLIPYVMAGGVYYGMIEKREDKNNLNYGGAPAAGGGGGIHVSITRFDPQTGFILDREYGISDMWFTLEAKALQGLKSDLDFTSTVISSGVTVDF
jgi:hypothetical protein